MKFSKLPKPQATKLLPLRRFVVEGDSMSPGYKKGERLLVSPILLLFSKPTEGDIVVIQHPKDQDRKVLKRIIGKPGDRIEGVDLGEDEYFVLGDNKGVSEDSRHFGPIRKNQILGKVWLKY